MGSAPRRPSERRILARTVCHVRGESLCLRAIATRYEDAAFGLIATANLGPSACADCLQAA